MILVLLLLQQLVAAPPGLRARFVQAITPEVRTALYARIRYTWDYWCRPEQRAPEDPWRYWFLISGRGSGKTRPAAEQVIRWGRENPLVRILLAGSDAANCRKVMVDGESGILACSPPGFRPHYYPTLKRLVWPNGAIAELHSAEEPKTFRGPQFHKAWVEELFHWPMPRGLSEPVAWKEGVLAGVRLGSDVQIIVTSTPRPTTFCEDLLLGKADEKGRRPIADKTLLHGKKPATWSHEFGIDVDGLKQKIRVVVSRWPTERNRANLAPGYPEDLRRQFAGTRLEQQELDGIVLARVKGAKWSTEILDEYRVVGIPRISRTLVAVDPTRADAPVHEAGIVIGGVGKDDGHAYVWDDRTVRGSISAWGWAAIQAYRTYRAEGIVYETNRLSVQDLRLLLSFDRTVRWIGVKATKEKLERAEPVAALYEPPNVRVHHVRDPRNPRVLELLEDEMTSWDPRERRDSPNRLDALVWLVSSLLLQPVRQQMRLI